MSSEGNIIQNWKQRVNLLLHTQLFLLYIFGFKRLFYHHDEDESQRKVSILKLLIFLLYLCAFILAFLQFAEGNISASVREEWRNKENVELMEMIPLSVYGVLAFTIIVVIFLSIFYFSITRDRPLIHTINSIKEYSSQSNKRRLTIAIFFIICMFLLISQVYQFLLFPESFEQFVIAISYNAGIGILLAWVVLQPLLVFTGLLLTFDTIAKDFPKPFKGYNRFNLPILLLTILIVIGMAGIISGTFGVHFTDNISSSLPYVTLSDFPDVFYSLTGISFMLMGVVTTSMIIISITLLEIILKYRRGINELQDRRMANFTFLFPFLIIYVVLKAIPFTFSFSASLRSLNNILDIFGLIVIMFFSIFRVLAMRDTSKQMELNRGILKKPKKWLDLIPTYSKALIIFYLVFVAFYAGLESNAVFTLSGAISQFEEIQMNAAIGVSLCMILYVFWRYKPENELTILNE